MFKRFVLTCVLLPGLASTAMAVDVLHFSNGTPPARGKFIETTKDEVTFEQGATRKQIPVNEVEGIVYEGEPRELTQARKPYNEGDFAKAEQALKPLASSAANPRKEIQVDIDFYSAMAPARAAVAAGSADAAKAAYKALNAFEKANQSSFHYYAVNEALGDLFITAGSYKKAEECYTKLAAAQGADLKMHADVLLGRVLLAQKNYADAIKKFDDVVNGAGTGKDADKERLSARLGKASAMAGSGKAPAALKEIDDIIAKADPDNAELHAQAYNAQGNCYLTLGKKKEALLSFLHTDVLYSSSPDQHAEALANLATLWPEVAKADRGKKAKTDLMNRYPKSRWAKQAISLPAP